MPFATLGNIVFKVLSGPVALDTSSLVEFAEHKLIEGKPRLQFMGEGLDTISIQIEFHSQFCKPENELSKLRAAKTRHQALALVYGNGRYKGRYVITDLNESLRQTSQRGDIISLEVRLTLKEWVDIKPLETKKQQKQTEAKARKKPGKKPAPAAKKPSAKKTHMDNVKATYGVVDKAKVPYKTIVRQ